MLSSKLKPLWAILGHSGSIWTSLVHSVRISTIQGHCPPVCAILGHSLQLWTILRHSGPLLKAIFSSHLPLADRFPMENTFLADRFYGEHRARETNKSLWAARSAAPPRGPKGPLGPGGPVGPPWALGWGVGGWGILSCKRQQKHERAETCTCKARRKQSRVDGNSPQG